MDNTVELILDLAVKQAAQGMLLGRLWQVWALTGQDPKQHVTAEIDGLIGALDVNSAVHRYPPEIREPVERELRFFLENLLVRLGV